MSQRSFLNLEHERRRQKTRREIFLETMERVLSLDEWKSLIERYYPNGKKERPVSGILVMLKRYLLQVWFNSSDKETEDAIIDSTAMRCFLGIGLSVERAPDATMLLRFRHLLEEPKIAQPFHKFSEDGMYLVC